MKDLRPLAAGLTLLAGAGIAMLPSRVLAQAGGPYAPLVLSLPAGAKPLAFGNVGVAGRDDDVLFYNPAQLVVARGMSGSFERYSANSLGGTLSSVTRFSNNAFAIGARFADYREGVEFASTGTLGSATSTPLAAFPVGRGALGSGATEGLSAEATVGYATVFKSVRMGAAVKYASDEVPGERLQKAALDLGAAKDLARFFTVALAVQNIGTSASLDCLVDDGNGHAPCLIAAQAARLAGGTPGFTVPVYLPLRTTLGGSFTHELGEFDFASTAAVSLLRSSFVIPAGGAELGYSWLDGYSVALRAGARRPLAGEGTFTAGAGFTVDHLSIDYALETLSGSRVAHRIGLRIR